MSLSPARALAAGRGPGPALAWPGGRLDAGALAERAATLAAAVEQAGPGHGPVGVVSASRARTVIGVLAADWLGRPALPLEPGRPDLAACLAAAGAGVVIGDEGAALPPGVNRLGFEARGSAAASPADGPGGLVVATSGSTGRPRLVRLSGAALAAQAEASARVLPPLAPGAMWLACLPMTSIGGLAALWRSLRAGAGLAVLEGFDAGVAASLMEAPVTHVSVVPAMLPPLVARLGRPPGGITCVLVGGGPLAAGVAGPARAAGWPLWAGWGMTETASHVAAGPVDDAWREGLAGPPLPGVRVTADAATGRLRIAGPVLMEGYAGPDGPGGVDPDGSFLSPDAGRIDADGRVWVLGRADEAIVTGGVNVQPEAVEALLADCPGLADVGVAGVPDERWGRRVVAVYAGDAEPGTVEAWARDRWASAGLEAAMRPRGWRRVAEVPRNAMGKLDRRALAALAREA